MSAGPVGGWRKRTPEWHVNMCTQAPKPQVASEWAPGPLGSSPHMVGSPGASNALEAFAFPRSSATRHGCGRSLSHAHSLRTGGGDGTILCSAWTCGRAKPSQFRRRTRKAVCHDHTSPIAQTRARPYPPTIPSATPANATRGITSSPSQSAS